MFLSRRANRTRWSRLPIAALLTVSSGMYVACGDDEGSNDGTDASEAGASGAGRAGAGGTQSRAGAGGTGPDAASAGEGGATQGDGGTMQTEGGATQGDGGTTQAEGGATQGDGGTTQAEGGATQGDGGTTQTEGGAAGAAGAPEEPCVGEVIDGECVALAPFARVQSNRKTKGSGAASEVVNLPADTARGNLLMLGVGVAWTGVVENIIVPSAFKLVEQRNNMTGTSQHESAALYVSENAAVLPAATGVTVSAGSGDARIYLVLAEYSGLRPSGALDQKASQSGTSPLSPGTTPDTTADNELWVVASISRTGAAHTDPTHGFMFVETLTTGAAAFSLMDRVVTARGAATTSLTGGGDFASIIATFRRRPLM